MKKPPAQRAKLKRSFDKTPVQLTKEDAPRSREFDLRKRVNWWLGLILILPLVISFRAMDPIGPSRFVVLSIFSSAFLLYFYVFDRSPSAIMPLRGLTKLLCVLATSFLAVLVISSFTAVNKQEALYCTARYALTLLTTILLTATVVREEQNASRLFKGLSAVLIIQSLVGILQFYGLAFTSLPPGNDIPYGLMANRTVFSSGLALLFPFSAYLVYSGSRQWKVIGGVALWLGTYAIILGRTRSAWVALAFGILISNVFVVLLRARLGNSLVKGWFKGMALFVVGAIVAAKLSVTIPNREGIDRDLKDRALSVVQFSERNTSVGSGTHRLVIWRLSWEMMRDHAVFGVGPGNWKVVVPRYGFHERYIRPKPDLVVIPDRAHNVYFQTGAETGIAGLLIYLGLWSIAALIAIKVILSSDHNGRRMLGIASLAAIGIYAVDSFFSFPNEFITHSLFVALALGIAVGVYEKILPQDSSKTPMLLPMRKACLSLVVLFLLFCAYLGYSKENFESRMRNSLTYEKLKRYEMIPAEVEAGRSSLVTLSPRGMPLEYYNAVAYVSLGQPDRALAAIQHAHKLNPGSIIVWDEMGVVYSKMDRWDDAIGCFEETLRIAPQFDASLKNLAIAYYKKQKFTESCETLIRSSYEGDESLVKLLGLAYRERQQYDDSAETLRKGLSRFPDAVELIEQLAYLEYTHLKDMTNAYVHLKRLLALSPNHPKRDEYTRVIDYLAPRVAPAPQPDAAK